MKKNYSTWLIFIVATAESFILPAPTDVILISAALFNIRKSFWLAALCSLGSMCGSIIGYGIGYWLYEEVLFDLLIQYNYQNSFNNYIDLYNQYSYLAIIIGAITPLPYKIVTITSGILQLNFVFFLILSSTCRTIRFFLCAVLVYFYADKVKKMINLFSRKIVFLFFTVLTVSLLIIFYCK